MSSVKMSSLFHLIVIQLLIAAFCVTSNVGLDANIIRIPLQKSRVMKAGAFGQPETNYYVTVGVGTPEKPYKLLIDINAAETWLPKYSRLGLVQTRLNYADGYLGKESSTSIKYSQEYSFGYMNTNLGGKYYQDFLSLKRVDQKSTKIKGFFLAVHSASDGSIGSRKIDGVLSLNPLVPPPFGKSFLQELRDSSTISSTFSLMLHDRSSLGGQLILGGGDLGEVIGGTQTHNLVAETRHWTLNMNSVMLGAQIVSCGDTTLCRATLTTSLSDIYGPDRDVAEILSILGTTREDKDSKIHEISCSRINSSPTLMFSIDGIQYRIPPEKYIRTKTEGLIKETTSCYVALFPSGNYEWVLGTTFFNAHYAEFYPEKRQVKLGILKGSL